MRANGGRIAVGLTCALIAGARALWALPPDNDVWHQRRSAHFTFLGNGDAKSTEAIASTFESLRAAFGKLVPGVALRTAPMDVYVFKSPASFAPYAAVRAGVDARSPGYYRSAEYVKLSAVVAGLPEEMLELAVKAYLADVVATTYPTAPPWVQSGLSQIYAGFVTHPDTIDVGRPSSSHVMLLRRETPIPFAELFAMSKPAPRTDVVNPPPGVFEAESWALMHDLLIGSPEMRPKTIRFLAALSTGVPARKAFEDAFGADAMAGMDAALRAYVAKDSMAFYALPRADLAVAPPGDPETLSRGETLYRLGWLLANIDETNAPQAEAHFRAALTLDPNDGKSLAGLGWIRSRAKKYDEAAPLLDQALQHGSDDPLTLTLSARNLLAKYGATRGVFEAPKTLPDDVAQARTLLGRALAACPSCAEAEAALGATYLYDPGDTAPGIVAIEKALTLAPPRADELQNLVSLYARSGDRAKGQAVIDGPIAALGDPAATVSARERLAFADLAAINAKIAAGDLESALTLLKTARDAAPTDRLRAQFESEIARIEPAALKNRQVATFNEAVALANKGDWKGAGALCDALLGEPLDPSLKPRVEDLQNRAKAAVPAKKK